MDMSRSGGVAGSEQAAQDRFVPRGEAALQAIGRLLDAADDSAVPLLERLRFLSRSAADLDAYTAGRASALASRATDAEAAIVGIGPVVRLHSEALNNHVDDLVQRQNGLWPHLRSALAASGIHVLGRDDVSDGERSRLARWFEQFLHPVLTTIVLDPVRSLPRLPDHSTLVVFAVASRPGRTHDSHVVVSLPRGAGRFVDLGPAAGEEGTPLEVRLVPMETVLNLFSDRLLPGYIVKASGVFRLVQQAAEEEVGTERESPRLVRAVSGGCGRRNIVRLEHESGFDGELLRFLIGCFAPVRVDGVIEGGLVGFSNVFGEILASGGTRRPDLLFRPRVGGQAEQLSTPGGDLFAAVRVADRIVSQGDGVGSAALALLRQAAVDADVLIVKWSVPDPLRNEPLIRALTGMAAAGRTVVVVTPFELGRAGPVGRQLLDEFAQAGGQLLPGTQEMVDGVGLGLVIRREQGGVRTYVCVCDDTAKGSGSTLSILTAKDAAGRDAAHLLGHMTGHTAAGDLVLEHLSTSPHGIRERILDHLFEEIYHARSGRPAEILLYTGSLADERVIDALYSASRAGVRVELVVGGICRLRSGIVGLSDNIRVTAWCSPGVDDSRHVFCFGGGGGLLSPKMQMYVSSAALSPSDLDRRFHVMAPIEEERLRNEIFEAILRAPANGGDWCWHLSSDGSVRRQGVEAGGNPLDRLSARKSEHPQ